MKKLALALALFLVGLAVVNAQPRTVKAIINKSTGCDSESYRSFTFNGSWCWFSDPRAVYFEGKHKRTYTGWVDNYGNITVSYYDHETNGMETHVIMGNLEIDDHDNPSILFDEEGKLLVFFTRHGYGDTPDPKPIFLAKSKNAEDISQWHEIKKLYLNDEKDKLSPDTDFTHTYTNPVKLSAENGKIYIFWRGVDGKPSYSTSSDNGETWAKGQILMMPDPIYSFRRPYTKVYSNGDKRIHFTFTDGHPRKEKQNSIYYTYYENGAFYKANGEKIKDISGLPLKPEELDKVYDGAATEGKAWNWDIAEDEKGNPVVVYATFPTDTTHYYHYAKWTGKKWASNTLINSGRWFPQTPENRPEVEPNYSGGLNIDHENANILYLSVKRDSVFEIEKWTTPNDGKSWKVDLVTKGSSKDNVRPFAVRGAKEGNPLQVVWMQNTNYQLYCYAPWYKQKWSDRFHSSIKMGIPSPEITNPFDSASILNIMQQAADWQLANPYNLDRILEWHWGTFFVGLQAFYDVQKDERYLTEMYNVGKHANWRLHDNFLYADQLTIAANWAWLYEKLKDPEIIRYSKWAMDFHLATRRAYMADVRFADNPYFVEWWTWCDALFMAPPAFAQMYNATGEQKYLDYMDKMFWITTDYLYSEEDSLMFRDDRYFERKSENGKKIFWGRGNGWVVAAITRILKIMPEDYPSRPKYEQLFKKMTTRLLGLQGKDNLWRSSLLDPEYHDKGEVSGSAFFVFALAWGINNGLIDEAFKPQVEDAWLSLCANVNRNGRLGNVQPEGIDPRKFTPESSHVYATGGFLLAGCEILEMISKK